MTTRAIWFIKIENAHRCGIGECAPLVGLSRDDFEQLDHKLAWVCQHIELGLPTLLMETQDFPAIQMALEMAFLGLDRSSPFDLFPSEFQTNGSPIKINGLVWMGQRLFMQQQIAEKLAEGFDCIKLKIGAIDWQEELNLLKAIRETYNSDQIEIRVDANGAFKKEDAQAKLEELSLLDIHSIEQPVAAGDVDLLQLLCANSPLPIALDESLIGRFTISQKRDLLEYIRPKYIILKPSLVGGFAQSDEWIEMADQLKIGWWVTSALESNIGLNAIAQWTYTKSNPMPQGLGTGSLFDNNVTSPLKVKQGKLFYDSAKQWNFNQLI